METNFDLPIELLANEQEFGHPFFQGLRLREAPRPLALGGSDKAYRFPTRYADVRCAMGIFHCSYAAVRDLLAESLGPDALPPRMLRKRSIVALSCYEYRRVSGLRPYNEIAVAIPLRLDGKSGVPVLGAFAGGPDAGYYIAAMPVTSEENRLRGRHFWGLPKITRRIDIEESGGSCRVTSFGPDGSTVDFSLEIPTGGKPHHILSRSFLVCRNIQATQSPPRPGTAGRALRGAGHKHSEYCGTRATRRDEAISRSPTSFEGDFMVNLNPATLIGPARSGAGGRALELGSGEVSELLARLGVEKRPLQTRYAASMNSWFDLPLEGSDSSARDGKEGA